MSGNEHTSLRTRIARGRGNLPTFAAPIVAAFVVLAIVGVLWVSGMGGGSGFGAATSPGIPPAKATFIAQQTADGATALANTTPPPKTGYAPPTMPAQPTPTFTAGIFHTHQGPFANSDFSVEDGYQGPLGTQWVIVYAGTRWTDFPNTGVGALRVYTWNQGLIGKFDAPDHSDWLTITAINGTVLQLQSDKSKSLTFDLTTDTFGS